MKFILVIVVGLIMGILLFVLRLVMKRLSLTYPAWKSRYKVMAVVEVVLVVIYIFWALDSLFRYKFYHHYLMYALLFVLISLLSWYFIRDIFAGIIFKANHNFKAGSKIRFRETSGKIKSFKLMNLEIRTDDGQLLRVPYTKIVQEVISEIPHNESMEEHTIHLEVERSMGKSEADAFLRSIILNNPWSNILEEPAIRFVKKTETGSIYEIGLYSMEPKHIKYLEMALEKNPAIKVLS